MKKDIFVAIIDSGCSFDTYKKVAIKEDNFELKVVNQNSINLGHGNEIGKIISTCDNAKIYDIQIFENRLNISALYLYKAFEYLLDKKVDVINLSLGILTNYKEIEDICYELIKRGVTIISSFPKSGQNFVYPASYKDVICVTSDGRCKGFDISYLDDNLELFGCNPFSSKKNVTGSSVAVAKFTKIFCEYLSEGFSKEQILLKIKQQGI
ncbi:hypothetical protein CPU12_02730 [Malaciobacter molluscorum LMG 25693]|uniref:Peptidase, S8 family n=1 Tax=Malaciobacter molluscorum LMG 25693 TaxID=870501 RepID=A0A2G1DL06_9BACT|nr:S8/S53 family peptidase [Malaciobacter molluscorum]AXX92763.1 peptidase, S8 family [Malaciobacter molluscorum LMG 25693]PHO19177.1 hypothetical protein CPU12_02730 [Malaciobacter molluscorum LMG 25693]